MKIKFLGTAAAEAIPALFCECDLCQHVRKHGGKDIRTRSQAVINDELLIDFPADTYLHVLRDGLELHKIHHCIITHPHPDHYYPEDIIIRNPGFATVKDSTPFTLYGTEETIKRLSEGRGLNFDRVALQEIRPFESFNAGDYKVTPLEADHGTQKPVIYLITKDNQTILYANDTGYFPESTWKWLEENKPHIDFVEFDCCYGLLPQVTNHMGFDTVCDVKNRMVDMGLTDEKTIFCINHFSHNIGSLHNELEKHAEKFGFIVAYDGLEVNI